MEKWKFHGNHEIFKNFMIFDMSESLVFPRKYLRFHKQHAPLGGPGPQKCVFGCNTALFRFLGPRRVPLAKPFINVTFWGRFWRPRGDFSPRNKNLRENHVLEPKSNFLLKTWKMSRNLTFFALKACAAELKSQKDPSEAPKQQNLVKIMEFHEKWWNFAKWAKIRGISHF